MNAFKLKGAIPAGPCVNCLERIKDGRGLPVTSIALADGRHLVAIYCSEREAGAWTAVKPEADVDEWAMRAPIEVAAWHAYVEEMADRFGRRPNA